MNIHQMSVSYVIEQDRLLIRINGKETGGEVRAWLTRRLTLGLLPVLSHSTTEQVKKAATPVETPAPVNLEEKRGQMLSEFEAEAALRTGDFKTPYEAREGTPDPLLGTQPLLLTEIKVTQMKNGQLKLELIEKLPDVTEVRNVQLMMDPQLSNGMLQLLHQGLTASQWLQLPDVPAMDSLASVEAADPAEPALDPARPKYLN